VSSSPRHAGQRGPVRPADIDRQYAQWLDDQLPPARVITKPQPEEKPDAR
jgi:hypothetical protein